MDGIDMVQFFECTEEGERDRQKAMKLAAQQAQAYADNQSKEMKKDKSISVPVKDIALRNTDVIYSIVREMESNLRNAEHLLATVTVNLRHAIERGDNIQIDLLKYLEEN